MKRTCVGMLLFVSCASSAPKMPPKPMTQLPSSALEMMCTVFKAEGMTSDLRVVKETQSIITPTALQALAQASMTRTQPKREAMEALLTAPFIPVETTTKACASRFVTSAEAARATDVMILQFSSPGPNPFAKGQSGTFVRMTLGGEAATWYWVPLAYRGDRWIAGPPFPLAFAE